MDSKTFGLKHVQSCVEAFVNNDDYFEKVEEGKKYVSIFVGPRFEKEYNGYEIEATGHFGFVQVRRCGQKDKYIVVYSNKIKVMDNTDRVFVNPSVKLITTKDQISNLIFELWTQSHDL